LLVAPDWRNSELRRPLFTRRATTITTFLSSVRYALRTLSKSPAFTSIAILSLALGIGANTAIFTLINALLLRDLPVRDPDQLVQLIATHPDRNVPFSYPMLRELARRQRVFTGLVGWGGGGMLNVEANGVLSREHVMSRTGNAYSELGVTPLLGRLLVPDDSEPATATQVAVLGYDFWQRRFGGSLDVVGQSLRIEGHPFTIVGVTRKWFAGMTPGQPDDLTVPITAIPLLTEDNQFQLENRALLWLFVTARLKPGVTIAQARSQLASVWPEVLRATASTDAPGPRRDRFLSMSLEITPAAKGFSTGLRFDFVRPLYVLAAIVGLILLLACVNLANLMLARAAARSHELSVRVAIGASSWSLARQVFTESLVLSLTGAALGLAFATWGSHLLVYLMTRNNEVPVSFDLAPDPRVLALTVAIAVFTGILFALAPAWRASRQDPAAILQQGARALSGGPGKLSRALIVTQIALSLVLLLASGLLVSSFAKLRNLDLGFRKERLLQIALYPRPGGYHNLDLNAYHQELLGLVSNVSGVSSIAWSNFAVPEPRPWHDLVSPVSADASSAIHVLTNAADISPAFFQTLGIPLLQGRAFNDTDDDHHPRVAIISKSLADSLFPGENALGKALNFGVMPDSQNLQIVGIAANARLIDIRDASPPILYLSCFQNAGEWGTLLVLTANPEDSVARSISHAIDSLGHEYVYTTKTVAEVVSNELTEERVIALLSAFFAALALLLASIGLYGLMSYAVTRRTREIGIRVALGGHRQNVLWMVLRETLTLAVFGLIIGIPAALAACRFLSSLLFGLTSSDVPTIATVSLLLLTVAALAGYLPARRASSIDPLTALRSE
jgi:predicted permease